jgi:hypothetical protein
MKKNPEVARQLLERALKELPYDSSASTAKFHIHRAINEIAKTIKKSSKTEQQTPLQKWQLDLNTGTMVNPVHAKNALGYIENLIAQQQAILQAKVNKNTTEPEDEEVITD